MNAIQFEGVKVAIKQDKTGYVLTLSIHPDDIPEELLRDFVGARYGVAMVRIDGNEQPMNREAEFDGEKYVRVAGMLCKDKEFWKYLFEDTQIIEENEKEVTDWLRDYLNIQSRAELKTNEQARKRLGALVKEFNAWKRN
jgi:hypothetical protein